MKNLKRFIFIIGLFFGFFYLLKFVLEWYSDTLNENGFYDAQHCIFDEKNHMLFYSSKQELFFCDYANYGIFWGRNENVQKHAYAVQVNLDKKTIRCLGGISWGFKIPWWSLRPAMILPATLSKQDWEND